jgi:hypothetical protein
MPMAQLGTIAYQADFRYVQRLCENAGPIESCYDLGDNCGGMA